MSKLNWSDLFEEVKTKGFENAGPLARLAWSCEIGSGVDQHASEDIMEIAVQLAALRADRDRLAGALAGAKPLIRALANNLVLRSTHQSAIEWVKRYGDGFPVKSNPAESELK